VTSTVRVSINRANMTWFLTAPSGPIVRAVATYTRRTLNAGRAGAPVDTGAGRAAMHSDVVVEAGSIRGRVYLPKHLFFHALGTGIYGPKGRPIKPVNGKYLVWRAKGGARAGGRAPLIFARQVKGVPRNDWMIAALELASPWPVNKLR
jgi:hypothetical protein